MDENSLENVYLTFWATCRHYAKMKTKKMMNKPSLL